MPKGRKRGRPTGTAGSPSMGAIEKMIMFPEADSVEPIRMRDDYTNSKTATSKPFRKEVLTVNSAPAAPNGAQLPLNQTAFAVFRDPLRSAVVYSQNAGGAVWEYEWQYKNDGTAYPFSTAPSLGEFQNNQPGSINGDIFPVALPNVGQQAAITEFITPMLANLTGGATFAPHGSVQYPGKYGVRKGMWIDGTTLVPSTLTVETRSSAGVAAAASGFKLTLFRWEGQWVQYDELIFNGVATALTFTIQESGYYAVGDIYNPPLAVGPQIQGIRLVHRGTCSVWRHLPIVAIEDQPTVYAIRKLAFSARLSNRNAQMFKSGSVVCANLEPKEPWMRQLIPGGDNTVTNAAFNSVASNDYNSKDFQFEKGFYGWGRVAQTSDLKMRSCFKFGEFDSNEQDASFDILDEAPAFVVVVSQELGAAPLQQTSTMFLHFQDVVEYHSDNVWVEHKSATVHKETFEKAFDNLGNVSNFMSNEGVISVL